MKVLSLMSLRVYHTLSKRESECIPRNIFKARKAKWGSYVCQESENKGRGAVSLFRWGEALITSTGAVKCWIRQEKCHNWQG